MENVRCGYSDREALKGISLEVRRGEFVGVLGPNGAGKTTLVSAISGIVPISEGRIEIRDVPLERLKHRERALEMAVVTQDAEARFPFPCGEVVRMGRYPHQKRWRFADARDDEAVRRAIEITDTESLADRLITAVSGGERQRVIVARALAQESPILLLDEAASAMDVHRKIRLFEMLLRLNRETDVTVVSVLHDVNLAALFCRRLIFLKDGEVVADGPTETALEPEILEKVYRTRVLVQRIPDSDKRQVVFLP